LDAIPVFVTAIATDSHADIIRVGAIDGLASSRFPDALDQCIGLTTPNHSNEARRAAIAAIPALASASPERAFNILSALMNDDDYGTRRAAVEAILKLDDPRARLTVEQWADAARSRMDRLWARNLLDVHVRASEDPASYSPVTP
jgi:HEAT repeat protein